MEGLQKWRLDTGQREEKGQKGNYRMGDLPYLAPFSQNPSPQSYRCRYLAKPKYFHLCRTMRSSADSVDDEDLSLELAIRFVVVHNALYSRVTLGSVGCMNSTRRKNTVCTVLLKQELRNSNTLFNFRLRFTPGANLEYLKGSLTVGPNRLSHNWKHKSKAGAGCRNHVIFSSQS